MDNFSVGTESAGFRGKLWRGEGMCLIGMDVAAPEVDLVGFAIEVKSPGAKTYTALRNRLNFAYDRPSVQAVTGARQFPSLLAPFQKFRWIHFPKDVQNGTYRYRLTKIHMPAEGKLTKGTALELGIALDPETLPGFLNVAFTRNFASSQAFAERYGAQPALIPTKADDGLDFVKVAGDAYAWLGFEALALLNGTLDAALADPTCSVALLAYDLNEPDIVARLEKLKGRLRAVIDNSKGHVEADSAESRAAARLAASAGAANVRRTHFKGLQHHKVIIVSRGGTPVQVLFGSTNFSFRGLYIQANNMVSVTSPEVAGLFARMFDAAFADPDHFAAHPLAGQWHEIRLAGRPPLSLCFSPHTDSNLSLGPVGQAIDGATSSVLFSIAFLNAIKSGPTRSALDRLAARPLFSYGVVDEDSGLALQKPDGSIGVVDFAYLAGKAPEPFRTEWSGGGGINIHHKFVVTDFNTPAASVFTGSSNLAPGGEAKNGDHLVRIQDPRVATAYAIEALRMFDHLHFRVKMKAEQAAPRAPGALPPLVLQKPTALSGRPAWFEGAYRVGSQKARDRVLFSA